MQSICFAVVLSFVFVQVSGQCNLPPSLWCSTRDAARLCQVESQCESSGQLTRLSNQPVNLTLYYEFLCGGCQQFITQQLFKVYQQVGQIINISLVPYGNAMEKRKGSSWEFSCQHGPPECVGNLIEVCTLYYEPKVEVFMPYIDCLESSSVSPVEAAKTCAGKFSVKLDKILACANSTMGLDLEHQMALRTEALNPPHEFVPWITVNGVHTDKIQGEAQTNLLKLICDTYQGPKPSACSQLHRDTRCWKEH